MPSDSVGTTAAGAPWVAVRVAVGVTVGVAVGTPAGVLVRVGVGVGVDVGVFVGVFVVPPPVPARHAENSEVLLFGSVAVAVKIVCPPGTAKGPAVKVALQLPSVGTLAKPRNVRPSPLPEAWQATFEKNSTRNVVLAVLFSVPEIVTLPPAIGAAVRTGKFWKLFGPVSASQASFAVTPSGKNPV